MISGIEKNNEELDKGLWELPQIREDLFHYLIWMKTYNKFFIKLADCQSIKYNKDEFDRLLLKTPLEKYTEQLWIIGLKLSLIEEEQKRKVENVKKRKSKKEKEASKLARCIEVTKNLLFFLENSDVRLKFSAPKATITIRDEAFVRMYQKELLSEFRRLELNKIPMSYRRGRMLLEGKDKSKKHQWRYKTIDNWKQEYISNLISEMGLSSDEIILANIEKVSIDKDMINSYIEEKYYYVAITAGFLKKKLIQLENLKTTKKRGAKPKNTRIAGVTIKLSALLKADRMLVGEKREEASFLPTNKDFKLLYNYFDFFGLIPKEITSDYQYVKSIYKNASDKGFNSRYISKLEHLKEQIEHEVA